MMLKSVKEYWSLNVKVRKFESLASINARVPDECERVRRRVSQKYIEEIRYD